MQKYVNSPINFPKKSPKGYQYLDNEPTYNPTIHLALEYPKDSLSLQDLGYSEEEIASCPTSFGVSGVARLLSDEGAKVLMGVAQALKKYSASGGDRIQHILRAEFIAQNFLGTCAFVPRSISL